MKITFAGIDESYPISEVLRIQDKYPEVEFALLISINNSGNKFRYPSLNYLLHLLDHREFCNFSLHLCGSIIDKYITYISEGEGREEIKKWFDVMFSANRIQMNTKNKEKHELAYKHAYKTTFIQPVNSFEERINDKVNLLWDKSGGKGVFDGEWPIPVDNQTCIYAGGIKPSNIIEVKEIVRDLLCFKPEADIRLDMESGIRDSNDRVDGEAIQFICKEIYGY